MTLIDYQLAYNVQVWFTTTFEVSPRIFASSYSKNFATTIYIYTICIMNPKK